MPKLQNPRLASEIASIKMFADWADELQNIDPKTILDKGHPDTVISLPISEDTKVILLNSLRGQKTIGEILTSVKTGADQAFPKITSEISSLRDQSRNLNASTSRSNEDQIETEKTKIAGKIAELEAVQKTYNIWSGLNYPRT